MQRLFAIIQLFKEYFVLALLIIISLILLSSNDNAQIRAIRSYTIGSIGFLQNAFSIIPNVFELKRENEILSLLGPKNVRVFRKGSLPAEFGATDDLSFLLHQ